MSPASGEKHETIKDPDARRDGNDVTIGVTEEEPLSHPDDDENPSEREEESAPPLPDEVPPPLPDEAPPAQAKDDGWEAIWDENHYAYYFYNRFTGVSQWENPRVPDTAAPSTQASTTITTNDEASKKSPVAGGYNPAIHGDYDPTAPYAQLYEEQSDAPGTSTTDLATAYAATGAFNRFTGRWQAASITPENHNDESKARRQMNAFFDVDAAANNHGGRSLRAERAAKKPTKEELKMYKEKRRSRKEEKRRAWLRD